MESFNKKSALIIIGIVSTCFSGNLYATQASSTSFDAHFLQKLHQANQNEIEMGKLAESKGKSHQVRSFGSRLIKDHSEADQKLVSIAERNHIDLSRPLVPQNTHEKDEIKHNQRVMNELRGSTGADFDQKFKQAMVSEHDHDVNEVSSSVSKLSDPSTKEFAHNLIPVLKKHEQIALQLPSSSGSQG